MSWTPPPTCLWVDRCPEHGEYVRQRWREAPKGCRQCAYAKQRRATERRNAVRRPPRPPARPGCCTLCGTSPLPGRRRSWCSDGCVELWMVATSGQRAHGHLVALHGSTCWGCGTGPVPLDVDHVRPLWSLTDAERTELRWWLPFNLQLLCDRCHRAKTKAEATARAEARRAAVVA